MLFIFDMGGVVTSTFDYNQVYDRLGMSRDDFMEICYRNDRDIWYEIQSGKIGNDEFWNEFCSRAGIEIKFDYFRMLFHPELNTETVELINELKSQGHRVICGTNTIQSHYEIHIERGDYEFFDNTYASNKIKQVKPDPDFFRLILEAEGVEAEEAFFTDDLVKNCMAAESVGIKAYCFDSASELRKAISSFLKERRSE